MKSHVTQRDESRDAARRRRGNENSEFNKLSQQLPLRPDITSELRDLAVTFSDLHHDLLSDLHSNAVYGRHETACDLAVTLNDLLSLWLWTSPVSWTRRAS